MTYLARNATKPLNSLSAFFLYNGGLFLLSIRIAPSTAQCAILDNVFGKMAVRGKKVFQHCFVRGFTLSESCRVFCVLRCLCVGVWSCWCAIVCALQDEHVSVCVCLFFLTFRGTWSARAQERSGASSHAASAPDPARRGPLPTVWPPSARRGLRPQTFACHVSGGSRFG